MAKDNYISNREIDGPIKPILANTINRFIRLCRSVFYINCMMTGRHSDKSYHYNGLAFDGQPGRFDDNRHSTGADRNTLMQNLINILNKEDKSIFEFAIIARLAGFKGLGIYPHHKRDGFNKPSLHGDCRKTELAWIGLSIEVMEKQIAEAKNENKTQLYVYLG